MKITILSGAGLSAESGLGTFRDVDGLWTSYSIEDVATPEGYDRNPKLVHDFYRARRENCIGAPPNEAHFALAKLQQNEAHDITLITQNIDNLLERAGATNVIHMHGELMRALCAYCNHRWDAHLEMDHTTPCPKCDAPARPDVVWFGEIPYHMETCETALMDCDLFVSIGTSAEVYPAAGFVDIAKQSGARAIEINLEASRRSHMFDQTILGQASETIPAWVAQLMD